MPDSTARARGRPEGLGRNQRLRSSLLFSETYRQGRRYVGRHMVLWVRTGTDASLRLGVVSSRKVGNAVARNRARRRLRELFRRNRSRLRGQVDVILVARRGAVTAAFEELKADWIRLIERAGLCETRETDKPKPENENNGP